MRHLAVVFAVMALGVAMLAQQRPPEQRPAQVPTFRDRIDIVQLDVSVLDRDRRPVRGLTSKDFTVLEDGKPQTIAGFDAVDIPDPVPPSAPWIRDVAPDVRTNAEVDNRRLFLIAIDDATIVGDPFALGRVKEITRSVVDRLGPADLAGIVFTRDNRNSQDFTSDRPRLLAAIDGFTAGFSGMDDGASMIEDLWMLYSVGTLQRAVDYFSDLPDRRKTIIYVSSGVGFDLGAVARPIDARSGGQGRRNTQIVLKDRMQDLFRGAQRANVPVYAIDPCGLRPQIGHSPCTYSTTKMDYLVGVSAQTGGRPIVNINDFNPGLTQIFAENASYYLIGFQSTNGARDGSLRRLQVKVNRPGVTVRTRSGYYAPDEDDSRATARAAAMRASPLGAAMAGVLPTSDLPLVATAAPFATPGQRTAAVAITVAVTQPVRQTGTRTVEQVNVQIGAYNTDGKSFGTARMTGTVGVRAAAGDSAAYEMTSRLDLKPGRYQLRIGAEVPGLGVAGSLYYDIVVPDFSLAPLSLSGLVLSLTPGPPSAVDTSLATVLPVVATTRRTFTTGDRVAAFARLYQGGTAPPANTVAHWQVRDADDAVVLDRHQALGAGAFAAASGADVRLDVPLAALPPGAYVLTLEAQAGPTSVRRDVRFHVR